MIVSLVVSAPSDYDSLLWHTWIPTFRCDILPVPSAVTNMQHIRNFMANLECHRSTRLSHPVGCN
jgi:hypothetical protein